MKKILFHLLYYDKNDKFKNKEKYFTCFEEAENYLKKIGATYWEIGFNSNEVGNESWR